VAELSLSRGVTRIASAFAFADTVRRLQDAFAAHGIKVFATIDQQAEAAVFGLAMPPTTLIVFGHPKSGTPLMLARPESGIDLPLKVLVLGDEHDGTTVVFNTLDYLAERHALAPELVAALAPAITLIEKTVAR
jgi:uncharacterized protein (DUF302 family)